MANRTQKHATATGPAGTFDQPAARRQGLGGGDVIVLAAMAAAAVAAGVGLHLQAELTATVSSAMAAGLFVLFAFIHLQRLRIDRLRAPERQSLRVEPALMPNLADDSTMEMASSQLAAAAAALRDGEPVTRRQAERQAAPRHRTKQQAPAGEPVVEVPEPDVVDHGWGEASAVDALVRQYAKELHRGPAPSVRPEFGRAPRPNMPPPAATAVEAPPEGPIAAAIRKAAAGDVDIHLQPIVAFADRKARLYEVFPRILDANGKVLTLQDYFAEAEAMGLAFAVERAAIVRCCAIQRKLSEKGRARAMIVRLSSAAIRDRAFLQRLVADINPDPLLADLILFEIDQVEIEQGDGVERENMEFLGKAGFRFSLGSAETLALEVQELTTRRIAFVRVTPSVLSGEHNPAAVSDLRQGGIETIMTAMVREEDVRVGRAFGLVLGQGVLFSEPKPLRSDVAAAGAEPARAGRTRAA